LRRGPLAGEAKGGEAVQGKASKSIKNLDMYRSSKEEQMMRMDRWSLVAALLIAWLGGSGVAAQSAGETDLEAQAKEPVVPQGFSAPEEEGVSFVEPKAGDDERYWAVIKKLTEAIHNEDEAGYRALFSRRLFAREGASLESSLSFMSEVMALRGTIKKFHPLDTKGMEFSDSEFPVRAVLFHMQDGVPGYFALALDDEEKIDHFSLFIKRDLCRGGKRCDQATIELEEEVVH